MRKATLSCDNVIAAAAGPASARVAYPHGRRRSSPDERRPIFRYSDCCEYSAFRFFLHIRKKAVRALVVQDGG